MTGLSGRRARICLVIRSLHAGGAERLLALVANSLQGRGFEPTVVVFYGGGDLELELNAAGVRVVDLRKRGRWDGFVVFRLVRILRQLDADVVYAWLPLSNLLCLAAKPLVRRSVVVVSIHTARRRLSDLSLAGRFSHWLNLRSVRWADGIIVNSQAGADQLLTVGRVPPRKVALIPNGVDIDRFVRDPNSGSALRREWGFDASNVLFGVVSTHLQAVKGHEDFLRAASEVAQEMPDARFVCFGEDSSERRSDLQTEAAELGIGDRVLWCGVMSDMPAAYSALDVVVVSSHAEGGPNAVIEAMACGVPCAVTDVGHAKEMVGDTGVCVAVGDFHELARAMVTLSRRSREDMEAVRSKCRQRVEERFGMNSYIARTLAALEPKARAALFR